MQHVFDFQLVQRVQRHDSDLLNPAMANASKVHSIGPDGHPKVYLIYPDLWRGHPLGQKLCPAFWKQLSSILGEDFKACLRSFSRSWQEY